MFGRSAAPPFAWGPKTETTNSSPNKTLHFMVVGILFRWERVLIFDASLLWFHFVREGDFTVSSSRSIVAEIGSNIVDARGIRIDPDANVSGTWLDLACDVSVLRSRAGVARAGMARLGDFLIDDSVEILLHEQVIVTVEDDRDAAVDEHLVQRFTPTRAILIELPIALQVAATPFPKIRHFDAAALIL